MIAKVYNYGAKSPYTHFDKISDILYKQNRLRNALVELELNRRKESDEILAKYDPQLAKAKMDLIQILEDIDKEEKAVKKKNQEEGRKKAKKSRLPELRKVKRQLEKEIRDRGKLLRNVTYTEEVQNLEEAYRVSPLGPRNKKREEMAKLLLQKKLECTTGYAKELLLLNETYKRKLKEAVDASGLHWSHSNEIRKDVERACKKHPRFRRYKGTGKIYLQVQDKIDSSDICIPNKWFYITGNKKLRTAHVRIGSNPDRSPIFADIPFYMHRELPKSQIVGVSIVKRRTATRSKWYLQISWTAESVPSDACSNGEAVALDLGWRVINEGLKVAEYLSTTGEKGILVFPSENIELWNKVDDLQQIRDKKFNKILDELRKWMKDKDLPDWFTEYTQHIHQWKSQRKLVTLINLWKDKRFPGDKRMYEKLNGSEKDYEKRKTDIGHYAGWRNWDKHLYEYQENLRQQNIAWRDDMYRKFAAELSRKYGTVKFENVDWSKTMRKSKTEEADNDWIKKYQRLAAPGSLRKFFSERFSRYEEVDAKNTSAECSNCGTWNKIGATAVWECKNCGHVWNRDTNACRNILTREAVKARGPVLQKTPVALAPYTTTTYVESLV